jgi:integrase
MTLNVLREWRLACPKSELNLVFPSRNGGVQHYKDISRAFEALQIETGMVDAAGAPKYTLHALRHFFASLCVNRRQDGGLELPAKIVQSRLGHSTIAMTLDTYGHLFPAGDDGAELAAAERRLFS